MMEAFAMDSCPGYILSTAASLGRPLGYLLGYQLNARVFIIFCLTPRSVRALSGTLVGNVPGASTAARPRDAPPSQTSDIDHFENIGFLSGPYHHAGRRDADGHDALAEASDAR